MAHGGWLGVDLFFVLSGFLITGILLSKKGRPNYFKDFYRRRVLRIFPLYYFAILLSVFSIILIDRELYRLNNGYDSLLYYLGFIPNFALAFKNDWLYQTNWVGLSHLWSLAVEEQYYILWPLIVLLLPARLLAVFCITLIGLGGYFRIWTADSLGEIGAYVLPYCRMDGLAIGSFLAIAKTQGWLTFSVFQKNLVRDAAFICFLVVLYYLSSEKSYWRDVFAAGMFAGLVYLALQPDLGWVRRLCETSFLRHIGTYSYGLYIFHQMFRMLYEKIYRAPLFALGLPTAWVQIIYILLAFGTTYILARLSFRFIEKPFLDRK